MHMNSIEFWIDGDFVKKNTKRTSFLMWEGITHSFVIHNGGDSSGSWRHIRLGKTQNRRGCDVNTELPQS
jgi:hypothetical protein